jgi:hypothetical protein
MSLQPPAILFHGTYIKHEGLKPRGRQYVHLSVDQETGLLVAKRKQGLSLIITVQASKAYENGIKFYQGNKTTWLADYVSPDYLNFGLIASLLTHWPFTGFDFINRLSMEKRGKTVLSLKRYFQLSNFASACLILGLLIIVASLAA